MEARWWHRQQDQVVCTLCPRECALHEGQRGFCFVRQNVAGEMVLTTYGRSTGFCIDPIEKKPLNHFLPGTPVLSFGTAGCNLGCKFCQNWSISKSREIEQLSEVAEPLSIAQAAHNSGCRSVAFTYNDPVIWAEYAIDTARECQALGIKTVAVTAGYISPEARTEFYRYIDAANVDLKGFTEDFYSHVTLSHLQPVLDNLEWLKRETNVWFELTNLMIPAENDSIEETARMCDWIVSHLGPDVPIHFTAFHPDFRMRDTPATPPETLLRAQDQARSAGIRFAYVGNVHHVAGQSTFCPGCGLQLIERDWYQLGAWWLNGNRCAKCNTVIPGVFEPRPGTWGARRQPVRIAPAVIPLDVSPPSQKSTKVSDSSVSSPSSATTMTTLETQAPQGFSIAEQQDIARVVRDMTGAALRGEPLPALPGELQSRSTYGVFVTYRRGGQLRACRGSFGHNRSLGDILADTVPSSLTDDPRFPRITASEEPALQIEVSVMYGPRKIESTGIERARDVTVGRHGLVLHHPHGRGLLLPQVAVEAGWSTEQFLAGVSQKAGLPSNMWLDPQTELLTFEAWVIEDAPPAPEFDVNSISDRDWELLLDYLDSSVSAPEPTEPAWPAGFLDTRAESLGLIVQTAQGRNSVVFRQGESLAAAFRQAGAQLRSQAQEAGSPLSVARCLLLTHPIRLMPQDAPSRWQHLAGRAWTAQRGNRWGVQIPQRVQLQTFPELLQHVGATPQTWAAGEPGLDVNVYQIKAFPPAGQTRRETIRRPAQAGRFYPAEAEVLQREVQEFLQTDKAAVPVRAVMLPHAGWRYCGTVLGATVARSEIPRTVILVGPKHTAAGATWSVSPADVWEFPGFQVPLAKDLRSRLLEFVPQIACEAEAHRAEHGLEVIVPFLKEKQPDLRILPLVMGNTSYAQTDHLAQALALLVKQSPEPVLLVISSDMHHFAADPENRRLDRLALDAMQTGDPSQLFDVVQQHNISMCGVMPAVTILRALRQYGPTPQPELVCYDTSATASGDSSRVVGYAGLIIA